MDKTKDWRIKEPEWKDGEVRYLFPLPIARPRTRPPKPVQLCLSLQGLRKLRARLDKVIADAEKHPQEVAKRREVQEAPPVKIPAHLIRPGLTWGKNRDYLIAYGTTRADLRDVPSEIGGRHVFKRVTGGVRPARAR